MFPIVYGIDFTGGRQRKCRPPGTLHLGAVP
ncbi:hypothetical protein [Salidesulfovibrio brasiliensis]